MNNIINKIRHKVFGYVKVNPENKFIGYALLSYITNPFKKLPWQENTDPHSSYWETLEIAKILSKKGYIVHIIDWDDTRFIPKKPYKIFIDINKNLQRLSPYLNKDCKKVMHIVSSPPQFQNWAEKQRLIYLEERTGIILEKTREEENSSNAYFADYLEGFGNQTNRSFYSGTKKDIFDIPISVTKTYPEIKRNFDKCKNKFIWFGGGGMILKGLDLVLEIFARNPQLELSVIGPVKTEKEFFNNFKSFFNKPNIKLFNRPKIIKNQIFLGRIKIEDFFRDYAFLIYPSASEGTSGSVIQSMHLGLIPVITKEAGLEENCPAIIIDKAEIGLIENKIIELSNYKPNDLENLSEQIWKYANQRHTRQKFSERYNMFIDKITHE